MSERRPAPRDVAFARSLLRHARDPAWLRAADRFRYPNLPRFDVASDEVAVAAAHRFLRAALANVPERVRAIVERTALGGQTCRDAARSVGVSLRQLHRDRACAAAAIARALHRAAVEYSPGVPCVVACAFDVQAARVSALIEIGIFDRAEAALQVMARSDDGAERSHALERLTACALERGHVGEAETYAVRALAQAGGDDDALLQAHVASAAVAFARGESARAERILRDAALRARASLERGGTERTRIALVEILVLKSQIVQRVGSGEAALRYAREARFALAHVRRPHASLRFATIDAHAGGLLRTADDLSSVTAELAPAYDDALGRGFIRQALAGVIKLATVDALEGAFERAAERLGAASALGQALPECRTRSEHAILLALALGRTKRARGALRILDDAVRERPAQDSALFGLLAATRGKARIATGAPLEALADLDLAIANLERYLPNAVGPCWHVKAQSLVSLRRPRDAEAAARYSVELIERGGGNAAVLAVAKRTLESIRR